MHIEFTQAQEQHLSDIVKLVNSAYRGEGSKKGWTTEADLLDGQRTDLQEIQELVAREESVILIAQDEDADDKLVGCVHLEKQGSDCYLGMLTVLPELQGKRIGKMLMEEGEAFAHFWDCTHIKMTVLGCRKELIAYYERRGFKVTGETQPFPYEDQRSGLPKVNDLYFEILKKKI